MTYRILTFTSWGVAGPYVTEAFSDALKEMGHSVLSIDLEGLEKDGREKQTKTVRHIKQKIEQFNPHFALFYGTGIIAGTCSDGQRTHLLELLGIPYASLFFDNPFSYLCSPVFPLKTALNSSLYTIFVWDKAYLEELRKMGFKRVYYLPLATNPNTFRKMNLTEEMQSKCECEISFVGSIAGNIEQVQDRRRKKWKKYPVLNAMLEQIVGEKVKYPALSMSKNLARVKEAFSPGTFALFCRTADREIDTLLRRDIIESLSDYKVRIFGRGGWEKVDNIKFGGRIDYVKELPLLYNAAQINLNITSAQLRTAVNQRVFDASACGAFVLSDYREDLETLFEPGEVVYYKNKDELKKLTGYYLAHPEERESLARAAQERVLKQHTWVHRMEEVVQVM